MQQRNVFAGPYLDRAAHSREDPAWFASALADPRSRAVLIWNSKSVVAESEPPRAAFLPLSNVAPERLNSTDLILLGRLGEVSNFSSAGETRQYFLAVSISRSMTANGF